MSRHAMLGNGALTVGIDEFGLVHDFYYPFVGLENLCSQRTSHHKIGVWVDGVFTWTDDERWSVTVDLSEDALTSQVTMRNEALDIALVATDFVDHELDAFIRSLEVKNLSESAREIRVFMHQVFQISKSGRADTALYVPDGHYIFDYKGRTCLLISGEDSSGKGFDEYAVGNYGIEGKEGTFRDAEDGKLSGSAVEHGGVDSVIRFSATVEPNETYRIDYWIAAGESQQSTESIHQAIKSQGINARLDATRQYWEGWLNKSQYKLSKLPERYRSHARKSLMVIKVHADKRGGIIASGDSTIYNYGRDYYSYVWPRDGAYAIWPLIRLGYKDEARKFFMFCKDILVSEGYLMHKYQPDKAVGSTWHPLVRDHHRELAIQEDETAVVLYMLGEYLEHTNDIEFVHRLYNDLVVPMANFLTNFYDEQTGLPHASYDLWEEKFLTTTYTSALVYQALMTGADIARQFNQEDDAKRWLRAGEAFFSNFACFYNADLGSYRKGLLLHPDKSLGFDDTIDMSSLYGMVMFTPVNESLDHIRTSLATIESRLLNASPSGGLPRYEHDRYFASDPPYKGNPWFVTTLWLAQLYIRMNRKDEAKRYIDWVLNHALASGILSEQLDPSTGEPKSVTPLVWSHAELINALLDLAAFD